ncbi:MAG: tetratricopeptide repeat protein [Magnetococcales bacterium]|nr:tetratricopeptide repeat protein [Magnetococcales bacterium]
MTKNIRSLAQLFLDAMQLYQKGLYSQAEAFSTQLLSQLPKQNNYSQLLELISKQMDLFSPSQVFAYNRRQAYYFYNLALLCQRIGGMDEALQFFQKSLEIIPDEARIINDYGNALCGIGEVDEAIKCYKMAIEKKPDYAQAYNNLGNAVQAFKQYGQSVLYYKKAISLQADYIEAYFNWGQVLRCQGYSDKAVSCFKKSICINPFYADGWLGLGHVYFDLGQVSEAEKSFRRAIQIKPDLYSAHNALGVILREFGSLNLATQTLLKATEFRPDYPTAFINLGQAYRLQNQLESAEKAYKQALQIDPDNPKALAALSFLYQETCSWSEWHELSPRLQKLTKKALEEEALFPESVFIHTARNSDPEIHLKVARSWSHWIGKKIHRADPFLYDINAVHLLNNQEDPVKIRVGYLANSFGDERQIPHLLELIKGHDRSRFEVYGYAYGNNRDENRIHSEIAQGFDRIVDIHPMSFVQAAELIHRDRINILLDLTGHAPCNRMEICALRPAPIQLSYLGFPSSSGSPFMDYILADKTTIPKKHFSFFSETVRHLSTCYQVFSPNPESTDRQFSRADFHLPKSGTVFCSFNQSCQLDRELFSLWLSILSAVPDSVLWLEKQLPLTRKNLLAFCKRSGVSTDRIIFSKKTSKSDYLARLRLADIILDTQRLNGQDCSRDALSICRPVITLKGQHFAARTTASMLETLNVPELIAHNLEGYKALAVDLATHPKKLKAIQEKIRNNKLDSPLFDTQRHVRELESILIDIWQDYLQKRLTRPKEY